MNRRNFLFLPLVPITKKIIPMSEQEIRTERLKKDVLLAMDNPTTKWILIDNGMMYVEKWKETA